MRLARTSRSICACVILLSSNFATAQGKRDVFPIGTKLTIERPKKDPEVRTIEGETHLLKPISVHLNALGKDAALDRTNALWARCEKTLEAEKEKKNPSTPAWVTGTKYTAGVLLLVGAFYLGTQVNR